LKLSIQPGIGSFSVDITVEENREQAIRIAQSVMHTHTYTHIHSHCRVLVCLISHIFLLNGVSWQFVIIPLHGLVRFHVLTAASMKMTVFWDAAQCNLFEVYPRFRGACRLRHQGDDTHRPDDGGSKYL
jgi:hypothetical protein